MTKKNKHTCFNAKCDKPLIGNFICIMYGGMERVDDENSIMSNKIEAILSVMTHSVGDGPFGSVDLHKKVQYNSGSQGESYFCCKQCLFDWFQRKLKDLPEPGTETYEEG